MAITKETLIRTLGVFNISTVDWGTGESKTEDDLTTEINNEESHLQIDDDGIARVTGIIKIHLKDPEYPTHTLIEVFQILPNGKRRSRNQEPSGKMKTGETPDVALVREAGQELYLKPGTFKHRLIETRIEYEDSRSYPGLPCHYHINVFEIIPNVEASHVLKEEFEIRETDGTVGHFKWVQVGG